MAQPRKPGRVFVLALIPPEQPSVLERPAEAVVRRLQPGASVTRYNRQWIVGQTYVEDGVLRGRIGFRGAEGMAEVWDDEAQDFLPVAVPAGLTAPFAVDLRRLRLAIQTRGSSMKLSGMIGALQDLLSEADQMWGIRSPRRATSFQEWRATVDRVTSVRFRVHQPNPHWEGTPDLEALLNQAEAEVAVLELQSVAGVDTDADFVSQSQAHVDRGYGEAVYKGVRDGMSEPRETVFNTRLGAEEEALDVEVNSETGEALPQAITEALLNGADLRETESDDD